MFQHAAQKPNHDIHAGPASLRGGVPTVICARGLVRSDAHGFARSDAHGFTLLEMMVVVMVIGLVSAIALPQLMPVIVFSRGEGAARHLAGFGRSAMAHVSVMRETITVKFDLDNQEYWAERLVSDDEDEFFQDEEGDTKDSDDFMDIMGSSNLSKAQGGALATEEEVAQAREAQRMRDRLDRFVRMQTEARARKLDKGSLFEDMGPLFEEQFSLEDSDSHVEEMKEPLLQRTAMPYGVKIDTMRIGSTDHRSGEVELELTALGLFESILFYVKNEDEDYFTVAWDPLTGTARFQKGKKDSEDMGEKAQ